MVPYTLMEQIILKIKRWFKSQPPWAWIPYTDKETLRGSRLHTFQKILEKAK